MASLSAADLDLDGAQKRAEEKERARNAAEDAQRKADRERGRRLEKEKAQAESIPASCNPQQPGTNEQPPTQSQPEQKQKRRPGRPRSKPKAGTVKAADRQRTAGLQAPTLTEMSPGQVPSDANRGSAGGPAHPLAAHPSPSQPQSPGAASPLQLAQASTQQRKRSQPQRPSASAAWRNSELNLACELTSAAAAPTSASEAAQLPAQPLTEPAQQPVEQLEGRPASQPNVKSASKRLKVQLPFPGQSASQPAGPAAVLPESRQPAASVPDVVRPAAAQPAAHNSIAGSNLPSIPQTSGGAKAPSPGRATLEPAIPSVTAAMPQLLLLAGEGTPRVSVAVGGASVAVGAVDAAASSPAADTLPISAASSPLRTVLPDVLPLAHSPTRVPGSGAVSQPAVASLVKCRAPKGSKRQPRRSPATRRHLLAVQQLEDSGSPAGFGSPEAVVAAQQPQQSAACLGATPDVLQPQGGTAAILKRPLAPSPAAPPAARQAEPEASIPKQASPPAAPSADLPEGTGSAVSAKSEGRPPGAGPVRAAADTVVPAKPNPSEPRKGGRRSAQLAKGEQLPQRSVSSRNSPENASPAAVAVAGNASLLLKQESSNSGATSPPAPSTSTATAATAGAYPEKPLRNGSAAGRTPLLAGKRKLRKCAASPDAQPAAKTPRLPAMTAASKPPAKVRVTESFALMYPISVSRHRVQLQMLRAQPCSFPTWDGKRSYS